uniref:PNPLA domain-containing protein n=1 Tax=Amphimedon queenslandica TaxID=400682 RepID=A0A1X7VDM8_AMPQE
MNCLFIMNYVLLCNIAHCKVRGWGSLIMNCHFSYHLVLRMRSGNVNKKLSTKMSTTRRAISFAGGGFMTIYHVGVLEAIAEEGARKQKLTKKKKKRRGSKAMIKPSSHDHFAGSILSRLGMLYGASGGAFIAVNIACGMSPKIAMEFIVDLHERAVSFGCCWGRFGTFHPRFQLVRRTREFFEKYLPPDAHKKCSGRVGVSMTVLPSMENKIITEFNTRAELIQALICSGFVPLFSGYKIPKFRGKYCCDGGLSSNLPYSTDPSVITYHHSLVNVIYVHQLIMNPIINVTSLDRLSI